MRPPRNGSMRRLVLIMAALATLLVGYYLGNQYQFGNLQSLQAIVLDQPVEVDPLLLPQALREQREAQPGWLILLAGDLKTPACEQLLQHYVQVHNRLAGESQLQNGLQLALLQSSDAQPTPVWQHVRWANAYALPKEQLLKLTGTLGISPIGTRWCQDVQANAALIGPDDLQRAILPQAKAAETAEAISTLAASFR